MPRFEQILVLHDAGGEYVPAVATLLPADLCGADCEVSAVYMDPTFSGGLEGRDFIRQAAGLAEQSLVLVACRHPFGLDGDMSAATNCLELNMPSVGTSEAYPLAETVPLSLLRATLERKVAGRLGPLIEVLCKVTKATIAVVGISPPWDGQEDFARMAMRQMSIPEQADLLDQTRLGQVKLWILQQQAIYGFCQNRNLLFIGTSGAVTNRSSSASVASGKHRTVESPNRHEKQPEAKRAGFQGEVSGAA